MPKIDLVADLGESFGSLVVGRDAELIPLEVGPESFELMLDLKRMLDPNNVMNPGKNLFDSAYDGSLER